MGNPAIGILHKNPEAELNRELLRRYRFQKRAAVFRTV